MYTNSLFIVLSLENVGIHEKYKCNYNKTETQNLNLIFKLISIISPIKYKRLRQAQKSYILWRFLLEGELYRFTGKQDPLVQTDRYIDTYILLLY